MLEAALKKPLLEIAHNLNLLIVRLAMVSKISPPELNGRGAGMPDGVKFDLVRKVLADTEDLSLQISQIQYQFLLTLAFVEIPHGYSTFL